MKTTSTKREQRRRRRDIHPGERETEAAKRTATPGRELGARTAALSLSLELDEGDCIGWPIRRLIIDTYES